MTAITTVPGTLGRDAELKTVGHAGAQVCVFSVADESFVKGEKVTTWYRCSLWGDRGAKLMQYLTKGSKVAVTGELSLHEYNSKTTPELKVLSITLMGGRRSESAPRADRQERQENPAETGGFNEADYGGDDDIPF